MTDVCRTYICRYDILPVSLRDIFRSRHRIIGVAVKVQSSIGEEEKQCHAIAGGGTYRKLNKISMKSQDRAQAMLHLVMVAKLAGVENPPACLVTPGKSRKMPFQQRSGVFPPFSILSPYDMSACLRNDPPKYRSMVCEGFT